MKYWIIVLLALPFAAFAQDPDRLKEEVDKIRELNPPSQHQGTILFTGSSSIKGWRDVDEDFPGKGVVNAGFGGSHATDLLHFLEELVIDYAPKKVFIYEGDNDLNAGKSLQEIQETINLIVTQIQLELPDTEIFIISPKPSIARWGQAERYQALNKRLQAYANATEGVLFVNVWDDMLGEDGKPLEDIFLGDNLHMNRKGYDIWAKQVRKYMD